VQTKLPVSLHGSASVAQFEDRMRPYNYPQAMLGAFESSDKTVSRSYTSNGAVGLYGRAPGGDGGAAAAAAAVDGADGNSAESGEGGEGEKRSRVDKQVVKKSWQALGQQIVAVAEALGSHQHQNARPTAKDIAAVIDEVTVAALLCLFIRCCCNAVVACLFIRSLVRFCIYRLTWSPLVRPLWLRSTRNFKRCSRPRSGKQPL